MGRCCRGGVNKFKNVRFDGIIAVDVFSHIRKEQDVLASLKNIWNYLSEDGLFLWYEINAKSHYMNYDADAQGFSIEEMDEHALRVGFKAVEYKGVYKRWTVFGKKIDTFYLVNDNGCGIVFMEILEKIIPFGKCINIGRVYKKTRLSE